MFIFKDYFYYTPLLEPGVCVLHDEIMYKGIEEDEFERMMNESMSDKEFSSDIQKKKDPM